MDETLATRGKTMFYIKRITGLVLLLALAATFIYSAYTKSGVEFRGFRLLETSNAQNAFDSFQWTFLDLGIKSLTAAGIIARIMVGLELMLGLFLLFHIYLKSFTYPAIIAVLVVFIIYLLMVIAKQGNAGNCGCFGNQVAMKPLTAIWKNIIMIAVTVVLMFIYPVKPYKYQEYATMGVALVAFCTPFLVNNMYTGSAPVAYTKPLNLDLLYQGTPAPQVDLRKGKHIIAFMSLTCPHCKKAAYLLHIIHREHPEIPIYLVIDGPESFKKEFFEETHAGNVPYLYFRHDEEFKELAGPEVPSIYWVNNGKIEYRSAYAYYQLDPKYMEMWMKGEAIAPSK
jgi:hypothetical protein